VPASGNHCISQDKTLVGSQVAIYMTTHLSDQHLMYICKCWPVAIERLPLLRDAHSIMHTSSTVAEESKTLSYLPFPGGVTVRTYEDLRFGGARVETVDVIMVPYGRKRYEHGHQDMPAYPKTLEAIHTDFTAFRPAAMDGQKLREYEVPGLGAERHMAEGVRDSVLKGRFATLPHWEHISATGIGHIVGINSPVIHHHQLHGHCPNYFNATDGKAFRRRRV